MTKEEITAFNRKIANSNPSELICVLYEMYFTYEKEALHALAEGQQEAYINAARQCGQVVEHLRSVLDFQYEISGQLYALYTYVERKISRAMYRKKEEDFLEARKVMQSLQEAFLKVAEQDGRDPMMANTQQVFVGLTYGRDNLRESVAKDIGTRGYWV